MQYVGTQVHMMVTINSRRLVTVKTKKLIKLSRYDVFEGTNEARVKHDWSKTV